MRIEPSLKILCLFGWVYYVVLLARFFSAPVPAMERGAVRAAGTGGVSVSVLGEVNRPGTYLFVGPSTVQEAIARAGGLTRMADSGRLNLSAKLIRESVLTVPSRIRGFDPVISLNRSSPEELSRIPGVGPTLAARIVRDREERGPFMKDTDLLRVPGIGRRKLERIMNQAVLFGEEP